MATRTRQRSALAATLGLWICAAVIHAASPPENTATARSQGSGKVQSPNLWKGFQPGKVDQTTSSGRTLVRYQHSRDPGWGYETDGTDHFLVALPGKVLTPPPLCVVLHSAGGNFREPFESICAAHHQRGFYGDDTFYVLSLDCSANREVDWWWGNEAIERQPRKYQAEFTPTEKRVLATIEWAVREFGIDRDRIYLNGISMGGSGCLGIGINHGELFAAVSVVVPAGVRHMSHRLPAVLPVDPPPLVNVSSHLDGYALGQEELLQLFANRGYSLTFAWEPFAHAATRIGEINPAVYDFPWLTIRKNEAYPVFARATTDQHYPGLNNSREPDQRGQINGYFRWKNLQDVDDRLAMELRLVRKEELRHPFDPPTAAEADLTLRRIQRFVVKAGRSYEWRMMAGSKALQSGKIVVGADGLLSVPKIRIAKEPTVFSITPAQ